MQNLPDREEAINEPTVAKGAEPIGVDVCDQFLEKYQDCVAHMPGNIREHMQKGLDSTERAWRATVAKSKDNLALEKSCNELQASVARATKAQGCSW